jgi:hypothetical protein
MFKRQTPKVFKQLLIIDVYIADLGTDAVAMCFELHFMELENLDVTPKEDGSLS